MFSFSLYSLFNYLKNFAYNFDFAYNFGDMYLKNLLNSRIFAKNFDFHDFAKIVAKFSRFRENFREISRKSITAFSCQP